MQELTIGRLAFAAGVGVETVRFVQALSQPALSPRPAGRRSNPRSRRSAMKTTELTIQGMHCEGCAKTVEALLTAEPGVKAATASYASGSARVLYDPGAADLARLIAAVARAGYRVAENR